MTVHTIQYFQLSNWQAGNENSTDLRKYFTAPTGDGSMEPKKKRLTFVTLSQMVADRSWDQ